MACLALAAGFVSGQDQEEDQRTARQQVQMEVRKLNTEGARAMRSQKYGEAASMYERVTQLAPRDRNAYLSLGSALVEQFKANGATAQDGGLAERADAAFRQCVELDPSNQPAIESLASLSYVRSLSIADLKPKSEMLDRAAGWYSRLAQLNPKNKGAYYSLGVVGWSKVFAALAKARADLQMRPDEAGPLKDPAVVAQLKRDYGPTIQEAVANLNRALEMDPEYADAMAQMGLVIRARADLAGSSQEYEREIRLAESWSARAAGTRHN